MSDAANTIGPSVGTIIAIILAIAALVILWVDLSLRRKIYKEDQNAAHEREVANRNFREKQFETEQEHRDRWNKWLEQQRIELSDMSVTLSEHIAQRLSRNNQWARDAIENAKLGPYAHTIFGDRKNHFHAEKDHLAEQFGMLLLRRCKHLIEKENKHVYLVIDSGTTLYPLFRIFGQATVRAFLFNEHWITDDKPFLAARKRSKLTIITNNLPGVETLMETGRPTPANRYSDLAVDCRLLPGVPLPIYSAVTGEETEQAIKNLKHDKNNDRTPVFIGIITGNWIRIRRSNTRCPVPLARGERHLTFKQALIDACINDEIYVISPLGKIFANVDPKEVNSMLGFNHGSKDPEKESYEEANIIEHADKVKLISTSRSQDRILRNLSQYLRGQLDIDDQLDDIEFIAAPIGQTKHILYMFDELPSEKRLEMELEFPHRHTRREAFMNSFTNP